MVTSGMHRRPFEGRHLVYFENNGDDAHGNAIDGSWESRSSLDILLASK